jgi:hypothetical protein
MPSRFGHWVLIVSGAAPLLLSRVYSASTRRETGKEDRGMEHRHTWASDSHEHAVERFYSRGVNGATEIHSGYLNFGLWEPGNDDYICAAENLVTHMAELLGLEPGSRLFGRRLRQRRAGRLPAAEPWAARDRCPRRHLAARDADAAASRGKRGSPSVFAPTTGRRPRCPLPTAASRIS